MKLESMGFASSRKPLLPIQSIQTVLQLIAQPRQLLEWFQQPLLQEALYLASPSLYERVVQEQQKPNCGPLELQELEDALFKYALRAAYRSTPFGLWASVGHQISGESNQSTQRARVVYLDGRAEGLLRRAIGERCAEQIAWQVNPTFISLPDETRAQYVSEGRTDDGQKKFRSNEVEYDAVLHWISKNAQHPTAWADIADNLASTFEVPLDEATVYLNELIEEGLLCAAIGHAHRGLSTNFLETLKNSGLEELSELLQKLNSNPCRLNLGTSQVEAYKKISSIVANFDPDWSASSTAVQIDLVHPSSGSLATELTQQLEPIVEILTRLGAKPFTGLDGFKRKFERRFESTPVPLLLALDPDWGVAYPSRPSLPTPLLEGLQRPPRESIPQASPKYSALETELHAKLNYAISQGRSAVVIDSNSLAAAQTRSAENFSEGRWLHVADHRAGGKQAIQLLGLGGVSGLELLGRFSAALPALGASIADERGRVTTEDGPIYAEIVHVAQDKMLNVVRQGDFSAFDLVLSGSSSLPREQQIWPSEILVQLVDGILMLFRAKDGRRIIPRQTTAFNFSRPQWGLYQFIATLQYEGLSTFSIDLPANLQAAPFLPRVQIDDLVIQRARWRLDSPLLSELATALSDGISHLKAWRVKVGLPRYVTIDSSDNSLPVDLENLHSVRLMLEAFETGETAILSECLALNLPELGDGWQSASTEELIIPVRPKSSAPSKAHSLTPSNYSVNRFTNPSGAWAYARVYTGASYSDRVLNEYIHPVMNSEDGVRIGEWFFVRYEDVDGEHLRLRFRASDESQKQLAISKVGRSLEAARKALWVSRIVWDEYIPESERYGGSQTLEICQRLFHLDSEDACRISKTCVVYGNEKGWLTSLTALDHYWSTDFVPEQVREWVLKNARDGFVKEQFPAHLMRIQLGSKFRSLKSDIDGLLRNSGPSATLVATTLQALSLSANRRRRLMDELLAGLAPLADYERGRVLTSILHMQANRLLHDQSRPQEAVLYEFLNRLDDARTAMRRRQSSASN